MKKLGIVVSMILALVLAACSSAAPGQAFTSDSGKFSVTVPVALTEQVQQVDTPTGGKRDAHLFSGDSGKLAYIVSYTDYPADMSMGDPAAYLETIRRTAVASADGGIQTSQSSITLDGVPGISFAYNWYGPQQQPYTTHARIFLQDHRLYQVMVIGDKASASTSDMDAFLATFKILK